MLPKISWSDPEQVRQYMRLWRANNRERMQEHRNRWKTENPEKDISAKRDHRARKRISNPDYEREYSRLWRKNNPEKAKAKELRDNQRRYAKPNSKLGIILRSRLRDAIKNKRKTVSAIKLLGVSLDEAIITIEKQFQPGMTWDNWGEWHLDHIRPLASFDLENSEHLAVACHISNLQPLWAKDNLRKGNKCPYQK